MFSFVSGIGVWLKNSEAARIGLAVVAGLVALRTWLVLHDRNVRRADRLKAEIKARKQSTKIINKAKEQANERIEDANEARDSVPDGVTTDSMSDDAYEFLFGRKRDSGDGAGD